MCDWYVCSWLPLHCLFSQYPGLQAALQSNACMALYNLTAVDDGNESFIVRAGGIQAIVEAMRRHPTEAGRPTHDRIMLTYSALFDHSILQFRN